MTTSDDELKARILAAVREEKSPTRGDRARQTTVVVVASVIFGLAVFFAAGGMRMGARPIVFAVATVGGWAVVAGLASQVAFGRGRAMLGRARWALFAVAIATPLALFGWMLFWNAQYPETDAGYPERLGFRCLAFTVAVAVVPLVGLALVRRERDPLHAGVVGAARGVAAGALAGVLVDLWCPIAHPAHVALGHILPLFLLATLGGLLGHRWSGVRLEK